MRFKVPALLALQAYRSGTPMYPHRHKCTSENRANIEECGHASK